MSVTSSGVNLVLTWIAPDNRGSPITAYEVRLLDKNDNTFKTVGICDYSSLITLTCSFTMSTARLSLGYDIGSEFYAIA